MVSSIFGLVWKHRIHLVPLSEIFTADLAWNNWLSNAHDKHFPSKCLLDRLSVCTQRQPFRSDEQYEGKSKCLDFPSVQKGNLFVWVLPANKMANPFSFHTADVSDFQSASIFRRASSTSVKEGRERTPIQISNQRICVSRQKKQPSFTLPMIRSKRWRWATELPYWATVCCSKSTHH